MAQLFNKKAEAAAIILRLFLIRGLTSKCAFSSGKGVSDTDTSVEFFCFDLHYISAAAGTSPFHFSNIFY